jgi:hypothetical protein
MTTNLIAFARQFLFRSSFGRGKCGFGVEGIGKDISEFKRME